MDVLCRGDVPPSIDKVAPPQRSIFFHLFQTRLIHFHFIHPSLRPSARVFLTFYPSALRAGGVLSSRSGRAGGCQTCGTHISVTAWWIFSIRSSVELFRPVVVHRHGYLPICPIWTCPWAKTCQIWHKLGPYFVERISLKPLDGLTPFKVSWTGLDL